MAVAFVTAASGSGLFSETASASITPSGVNRLLIAIVAWGHDGGQTVSSVVFNTSESLTRAGGITKSSGTIVAVDIWYLVNPTATTANVVATLSAAPSSGTIVGAMVFSGVDQASPLGTISTQQGTVNPDPQPSLNISSAVGDMVIDGLCVNDAGLTPGAGQTERFEVTVSAITAAGSNEDGASSVTMSYSALLTFSEYVYSAINIKQASAADTLMPQICL